MYGLTFGPHEEQIAAAAVEMGQALPETVSERPEIRDDFVLYWEAYLDLTGTRTSGFGLGPIPWTSIDAYAKRFGFDDPEDFQTLKEIVWGVDKEYMAWHEKSKKKN